MHILICLVCRVTTNVFRKRLEMEVEFGRLRLGINDARQTVFLADVQSTQAEEIIRRMAAANMSGMSVTQCETLPRLIEIEDRRNGGGGGYGRDGGSAGGRHEWSNSRSSGWGGDRRGGSSSYGGNRDGAGSGARDERKSWQSRTNTGGASGSYGGRR